MAAALVPGAFVVGCALGFGAGYLVAKKRLETKYDKIAQTEIDEAREYYRAAKAKAEERVKAPITEVVEYLGYVKKDDPPGEVPDEPEESVERLPDSFPGRAGQAEEEHQVEVQVGASTDDIWDYMIELAWREANPGSPFVIHLDEYGEEASEGFTTAVFTYYEEDDILADERDEVVDDIDGVVGLGNLEKFGHGTDNADVVLVRNPVLRLDIEVIKAKGSYAVETGGSLKHSYDVERMPRRRQGFDDEHIE